MSHSDLENEDDPKKEHNTKNEDGPKNEDDPKNEDVDFLWHKFHFNGFSHTTVVCIHSLQNPKWLLGGP